ncbi:hypothetical protein LTR78_007421 [Recurvomyces mirabilis]|uniref:Heterokaryon incompatibility domain-containing protein n=1 Tax=Recurvomyces mirabilis TaxID=574656 RepID=A0AAE0TU81_9PEZI|nr:hypothetical protein LTR78_007421 [Recurvomyces mirabilis]KAK5160070.1 hypothetical protein LTS14_002176 [Recurvomyces mirabilis]
MAASDLAGIDTIRAKSPSFDDSELAAASKQVRQLLTCCEATTDEVISREAKAQVARFDLWASNIGVFAKRHASLDYRLRAAPISRAAIESSLDTLCNNIFFALTGDYDVAEQEQDRLGDLVEDIPQYCQGLIRRHRPAPTTTLEGLHTVGTSITSLHRLSLAIRKSGNRNSLSRVPGLLDVDHGYTLFHNTNAEQQAVLACTYAITSTFEDFVRSTLSRRWLQYATDPSSAQGQAQHTPDLGLNKVQAEYRSIMLDRCVAMIVSRRRLLVYFGNHQSKLENSVDHNPGIRQKGTWPNPVTTSSPFNDIQALDNAPEKLAEIPFSETEASIIEDSKLAKPMSEVEPSVTSSTGSSTLSEASQEITKCFDLPSPPLLSPGEREGTCPYCRLVLPAKEFSKSRRNRKWKHHLWQDLQPYCCLHSSCPQSGKRYGNLREWQAHLDQPHILQLDQTQESNELELSNNFRAAVESKAQTEENVIASQSKTLSEGETILTLPDSLQSGWCFVCLGRYDGNEALRMHTARHLEIASLLALPLRQDVADVDDIPSSIPSVGDAIGLADSAGGDEISPLPSREHAGRNDSVVPLTSYRLEALDNQEDGGRGVAGWLVGAQDAVNLPAEMREALADDGTALARDVSKQYDHPTRLIDTRTLAIKHIQSGSQVRYGILSHVWGPQEISYENFFNEQARDGQGFTKVWKCCKLALEHGLDYMWIDSCCIDRGSTAELSEAINSMFAWYASAAICFVYLADVGMPTNSVHSGNDEQFFGSRWFTRGWSLQELLAPRNVRFFDCDWRLLGTLSELTNMVKDITGLETALLRHEKPISAYSVAQRMSWAAGRMTTRREDMAYCLLGIFEVHMPLLYGEDDGAFLRLQHEVCKRHRDDTIFAWSDEHMLLAPALTGAMFAPDVRCFLGCRDVVQTDWPEPLQWELTQGGLHISGAMTMPGPSDESTLLVLSCAPREKKTSRYVLTLRYSRTDGRYTVRSPRQVQIFNVTEIRARATRGSIKIHIQMSNSEAFHDEKDKIERERIERKIAGTEAAEAAREVLAKNRQGVTSSFDPAVSYSGDVMSERRDEYTPPEAPGPAVAGRPDDYIASSWLPLEDDRGPPTRIAKKSDRRRRRG